jgi:hypothetical protein
MDGSLVGRAKVQRWQRCRLQRCCCCCAAVIAARAHNDGAVVALTAALLRPYSVAAMAGSLRRCCGLAALLQWPVARSAATASQRCCDAQKRAGARNANNAVEPWPTLRCSVFIFIFFYSTVSKREREQDREKRDRASKLVSRLCWLASSFNVNSL